MAREENLAVRLQQLTSRNRPLKDISDGQLTELKRVLNEAGMDLEFALFLKDNPLLAREMIGFGRNHPWFRLVGQFFTKQVEQLRLFAALCDKHAWPFCADDIELSYSQTVGNNERESSPTSVRVLTPQFGKPLEDLDLRDQIAHSLFKAYLFAAAANLTQVTGRPTKVQTNFKEWVCDFPLSIPSGVGVELGWETLSLTSHRGGVPMVVSQDSFHPRGLPAIGVVAAITMHPHWLERIVDGAEPGLVLGGYQFRKCGDLLCPRVSGYREGETNVICFDYVSAAKSVPPRTAIPTFI